MNAKDVIVKILPYIGVLLVGAAISWYLKPDVVKIEEKEELKEVQVTTEAHKELLHQLENLRIELNKIKEVQVTEKYHRETLETRLPDGTVTKKTTVDKNIDSHTKETETKVEVKVVEVEKKVETIKTEYVDRIVVKEKTVTPVLAKWHVGLMGGLTPQVSPSVGVNSWLIGGEVERRIAGPFWGGLWGMGSTTGQAAGGIKIGIEF